MKIHHTECFKRTCEIKTDLALEIRDNAQVLEHVATLDRLKAAEVFSSVQYSF